MNERCTPDEAWARLTAGNERFTTGQSEYARVSPEHLRDLAQAGQNPFATVVGCSDSRCPVEHIFDAGVGDIFVIRVAGNFCSGDEIASIEYAVGHLETPLVVVLGHTRCGAVTAAVAGEDASGKIPRVLAEIEPAVHQARAEHPGVPREQLVDAAARHNVRLAIENLLRESPLVVEAVQDGRTVVRGAFLDLETGRVCAL